MAMAVTNEVFNPQEYLSKGGFGKTLLQARKNEGIFSQGEPGDTVFYIQKGKVKLTVVSPAGKEATIAILGAGHFIGEGVHYFGSADSHLLFARTYSMPVTAHPAAGDGAYTN